MKGISALAFAIILLCSCSDYNQDISDELYNKALFYSVFEEGPLNTYFQEPGCIRVDSNGYYFGDNHYAVSKYWYSANIYQLGDTMAYFGGSCIFRTDVFVLNRFTNKIYRFDAEEFHRKQKRPFQPESLYTFEAGDTLDVLDLNFQDGCLRIYKEERLMMEIKQTSTSEAVSHFYYWNGEGQPSPSSVYSIFGDSLVYLEKHGGPEKKLVIKSDSTYSIQEFRDDITLGEAYSGEVAFYPNCN